MLGMCAFASGITALMGASLNGYAAVVAHLLDKGADVNAADNNGKCLSVTERARECETE